MIILNHYCGISYRALGKPKLSTLSEWLHIIFLWPAVVIAAHHGFECLYVTRSLIRLQHIVVDLLLMHFVIHFPVGKMIKNILPSTFSACVMTIIILTLHLNHGAIIYQLCMILTCILLYFSTLCIFKEERHIILGSLKKGLLYIKK